MENALIDHFIHSARGVMRDSYERRIVGNLAGGIWYAPDYYKASTFKEKRELVRWQPQFFHGHAPLDVVQPVLDPKSPTGRKPLSFVLKKGVPPSLAIQKIGAGLSLLDCATVVLLALYKALLELFQREKFDRLFGADSTAPFRLSTDGSSPLTKLLSKKSISGEQEVRRGDICYFSNVKEYVAKHPVGASRGDHVICISENPHHYIGFGFSAQGLDKKGVEYELWDCFSSAPLDEGYCSPHIWKHLYLHYHKSDPQKGRALVDSFRNLQFSWEEFQKRPCRLELLGLPCSGKMGLWVYRVDLNNSLMWQK